MAACVLRSARESPPTHEARVSVEGYGTEKELTQAHSRLFRKLRKYGCEYLAVNEWGETGQRHLHILIRAAAGLTEAQVHLWWENCLTSGARAVKSHCAPIRSVTAFVKYAFKDVGFGGVPPPSDFKGKVYTASRNFLVRSLATLWEEVREQWFRKEAAHGVLTRDSAASRTPECQSRGGGPDSHLDKDGVAAWERIGST